MRPKAEAGMDEAGRRSGGGAPDDAFVGGGSAPLLPAGTLLDGRYEVVRLVGQGSFAAVYEARHQGLHSRHAVKVLHPEIARADDTVRGRFLDEGRIQANLRHPHIVAVTEIVTDPLPGLVLEYVDGPNLYEYLAGLGRRLAVAEAVELMLPVADAIAAAHGQRIIHRDLKPENILVGRGVGGRPHPKVTDFGIAKALAESPFASGKRRTRAGGKPMGTLSYLSPEQIRAPAAVDQRSDVFALGAILYELLTGELAFDGETDFEVMSRIVNGSYRPPEELVSGLPAALAQCIRSALAADPSRRIQSAETMRDLLRAASDGSQSPPPAATAPVSDPMRTASALETSASMDAEVRQFIEDAFDVCRSVLFGTEHVAKARMEAFETRYEQPWIDRCGSSLLFHPPEILRGEAFEQRSWVYYLSALFYAHLSGRPPFVAETESALRAAILAGRRPTLQRHAPVSPSLVRVLDTGLATDPERRFQSLEEFFTALGRPGLTEGRAQRPAAQLRHEDPPSEFPLAGLAGLWAGVAGFVLVLYAFGAC